MLYLLLKYLHVIGATVLLGTGAGIAFFMLLAHRTENPVVVAAVARIVVIADFLFTASAVVAQPITGTLLAWQAGYSLWDGWIAAGLSSIVPLVVRLRLPGLRGGPRDLLAHDREASHPGVRSGWQRERPRAFRKATSKPRRFCVRICDSMKEQRQAFVESF
jgi:hypothetical protein